MHRMLKPVYTLWQSTTRNSHGNTIATLNALLPLGRVAESQYELLKNLTQKAAGRQTQFKSKEPTNQLYNVVIASARSNH